MTEDRKLKAGKAVRNMWPTVSSDDTDLQSILDAAEPFDPELTANGLVPGRYLSSVFCLLSSETLYIEPIS